MQLPRCIALWLSLRPHPSPWCLQSAAMLPEFPKKLKIIDKPPPKKNVELFSKNAIIFPVKGTTTLIKSPQYFYMSISKPVYSHESISIEKLLESAQNRSVTIPCIQRPFVWSPRQIATFVESLLRGWPYGIMLFLEKSESEKPLFSSRCFSLGVTSAQSPEENINYRCIVLDGQQRYQSMVVAFAEKSGGYEASAKEWADDGCPVINHRQNRDRIVRYLCFNTTAWRQDSPVCTYVETEDPEDAVIIWRSQLEMEQSPRQYVKLSDVFNGKYPFVKNNNALIWLQRALCAVKKNDVPILKINQDYCASKNEEPEDAVVNMFTRLNMSGTPLTKEQLLASRIKTAWSDFPEKLSEFIGLFSSPAYEMPLDADEVVNGFNIVLKAITKESDIRKIYQKLTPGLWSKYWVFYSKVFRSLVDELKIRQIRWKHEFHSLYLLWFAVALVVLELLEANSDFPEDESTSVNDMIHSLIRWMFVSTWSGMWANKSGQSVKHYTHCVMQPEIQNRKPKDTLNAWVSSPSLQKAATDAIDRLMASSRGSVRQYYTYLLVWHRMNEERTKLLSFFGSNPSWDVDHLLPFAWNESKPELIHAFSNIGNCWLLESTANVRKSDDSFPEFLKGYKKDVHQVAGSIEADEQMLSILSKTQIPDNFSEKIREREACIKSELKQYVETMKELSYVVGETIPYTPDIFKGERYFNSEQYKQLKTDKCKSSYLSNIRRVHKALGWSVNSGPCPEGTSEAVALEKIKNEVDSLISCIPDECSSCRSAWKAYIEVLSGKTASGTKRRRSRQERQDNAENDADAWSLKALRRLPRVRDDESSIVHQAIQRAIDLGCSDKQFVRKADLVGGRVKDSTISSMSSEKGNAYGRYFDSEGKGINAQVRFVPEIWSRLKELEWVIE